MEELNLRELLARESEQVEWKENVADVDNVVATLSAFANDWANLGGGYVVCGAAEGRDEHGFAVVRTPGLTAARFKEVEGQVMTRCRERVTPPIVPLVHELPADEPSRRVLVFVMPATRHAHVFRRKTDSGMYYVRQSRSTVQARNGLFRELMVRKGDLEPWDHRPNPEARVEDIDLVVLRDTLQRMSVWDQSTPIDEYLRVDHRIFALVPSLCAKEPLTSTVRPRNFTLLLFGRDVPRFVPGAHVVFSSYPGFDRSEPHSEAHFVYGPLFEQIRGLKERLAKHVPMLIDKEDPIAPNAVKYPLRALEEAVVNALVHRDYAVHDPVHVTVFADRVEIVSPGGLPSRVDEAAFREGKAAPVWRNQVLAWFCRELSVAQALGQGVVTIFRTMRDAGCPPPEYALGPLSVSCVLRAHPRATRAAVMVRFDSSFRSATSVGFSAGFEIPNPDSELDWARLRSTPVDAPIWRAAMDEIDRGLERVLEATRGELHVFASVVAAIAVYLGRRLSMVAGTRAIVIHQPVRDTGAWESIPPLDDEPPSGGGYFEPLGVPQEPQDASAVLLVIDCSSTIPAERIDDTAHALGAAAHVLRGRAQVPLDAAQLSAAVFGLREALETIAERHPRAPLHLVMHGPAALFVELGRLLSPTVFPRVVAYHYVRGPVSGASFVPAIDVIQRRVVASCATPP